MTRDRGVVILSVRSPHVDRLLDGTKTIELRRTSWRVAVGTVALLYASGPGRRQLVGSATVDGTFVAPVDAVWREFAGHAAVTRGEFDRYFAGVANGVAIRVRDVRRLPEPIPLAELRRRHPRFRPPQSFRYVDHRELSRLLNGERPQLL